MKLKNLLAVVFVVGMSALCIRLGFWQISRLHEKQRLNAALRSALASTPVAIGAATPADSAVGRRVEVTGRYDEHRQLLLAGRAHAGAPGVSVVTPLVLANGTAVLVERGWLYSDDATHAHPERWPEPGERTVVGVARAFERHAGRSAPISLSADPDTTLLSARWLDRDSIASAFPYALAPFVVKQLPGPGVPSEPIRTEPAPYDETMHLSYAIQWFLFAAILSIGSLILARTRRRGTPTLVPRMPTAPSETRGG